MVVVSCKKVVSLSLLVELVDVKEVVVKEGRREGRKKENNQSFTVENVGLYIYQGSQKTTSDEQARTHAGYSYNSLLWIFRSK